MTKLRKKNLKKQVKPITFFQTIREKLITINLVTQLLRVVVEVVSKASEVLIVPRFLIFLKIFLVTSAEAPQEERVIGEMI